MIIRFKKLHPNAVTPAYSRDGDAAVDLTAVSFDFDENGNLAYGTGIGLEIPKGYVGLIYPRSSICKKSINLVNCVAVIDSNFRGEIVLKFRGSPHMKYNVGERIAQLIIQPIPEMSFVEVETLTETNRGQNGFGSSGV
jgi:dUTP pyrophosphatase